MKLESNADTSWHVVNRSVEHVVESGRRVTRFDERPGAGMVWTSSVAFRDGDLEFDVKGRDVLQKSFVGVAFHIVDDTTAEIVWLRPFNFRSADSTRRPHSVQYTSYPVYSWQKLRADHPGGFESAVPPDIDPNNWIHVRVSVRGADVRVFLQRATVPILAIHSPGPALGNRVGLWVGDQANGDFANFTVTPVR